MVRTFEAYKNRKVTCIDGMWRFKLDPEKQGFAEEWFKSFPDDNEVMIIPSCWNNELGKYDYEGIAWYKTSIRTSSENINIIFEAVTGQAEVYLDGKHLGSHYGGFSPFNFVVNDLEKGEHILVVAVDNIHDDVNTIPLSKVDWFHYGGITRSVELQELVTAWIDDYRVEYELSKDLKRAELKLFVNVSSLKARSFNGRLNVFINDEAVYTEAISVVNSKKIKIEKLVLENIKLWDINCGNLYRVRFEITEDERVVDDLSDRIGFRTVGINNGKILLNGREIYLKGINRHEEHPEWGFAFPLKLMKKDMEIIKDLGCNCIRGSHYPNSRAFLDYCDEEGIMFTEEIPMWQYHERHLNNPIVVERGLKMHEEMVMRDYHHPSIIMWGLHNEIDTSCKAAYEVTKQFLEKVKSIDSTRLITYASDKPFRDICFSLVDIISINKYYGWYEGKLDAWDKFIVDFNEKLKADGLSNKPIIISEFGAGGIHGDVNFEGPKWTENYQEKLIDYTLNLFYKEPSISGSFIWQFCDIRTAKELEMGRARSFNNKGILNEYRKPKLAYWTVKKIYTSIENEII